MKHIIIGTAGHVDHGKTTLIEALTGRDTDRLREEKERGISIEACPFDCPADVGPVVDAWPRAVHRTYWAGGGTDLCCWWWRPTRS